MNACVSPHNLVGVGSNADSVCKGWGLRELTKAGKYSYKFLAPARIYAAETTLRVSLFGASPGRRSCGDAE